MYFLKHSAKASSRSSSIVESWDLRSISICFLWYILTSLPPQSYRFYRSLICVYRSLICFYSSLICFFIDHPFMITMIHYRSLRLWSILQFVLKHGKYCRFLALYFLGITFSVHVFCVEKVNDYLDNYNSI